MTEQDIQQCAAIAQQYRSTFGFISATVIRDSVARKRILVVRDDEGQVTGWLRFGLHEDHATISLLCVAQPRQGAGTKLLQLLEQTLRNYFTHPYRIMVKCPVDEAANMFYERRGFVCTGQVPGRRRKLNVWEKTVHAL